MATRNRNESRPFARRVRRILLATALACPLIAAPASAVTINPVLSVSPVAGQPVTCLSGVLGLLPGQIVHVDWGSWGTARYPGLPATITLPTEAGGSFIFCEVSVTLGANGPNVIPPVAVGPIRVKGIAPSNLSLPSVSGKARAGRTATCKPGNWTALPSSYSFRWLRDGSPTSTGRTRKLTSADAGHSVACRVTANNPFGTSAAATSPARSVL